MNQFQEFIKKVTGYKHSSMEHKFPVNYCRHKNKFIEEHDIYLLLDALQKNKKLKNLRLFFELVNQYGDEVFEMSLARTAYTEVSIDDVQDLSTLIAENKTLSELSLDLANHRIGNESQIPMYRQRGVVSTGPQMLASAMKKNKTLSFLELNLSCTDTGDKGVAALSEAIKENNTLKSLSLILSWNSVEKKGVISLSKALMENKTLSDLVLVLNGNSLAHITQPPVFTRHGIRKNYDAFYALSNMLAENKNLKSLYLDLTKTGIDDKGIDIILEGIEKNQSLTDIVFRVTPYGFLGKNHDLSDMTDEEKDKFQKKQQIAEMRKLKIKKIVNQVTQRNKEGFGRKAKLTETIIEGSNTEFNNSNVFNLLYGICLDENCSYLNKPSNDENSDGKSNKSNNISNNTNTCI